MQVLSRHPELAFEAETKGLLSEVSIPELEEFLEDEDEE